MKLSKPPKIRWSIRGFVPESVQKRIRAEAQKQIGILRNAMRFQKLSQGRSRAHVGGLLFTCISMFGLETVDITMTGLGAKGPIIAKLETCWCIRQLTEGLVIEIIAAGASGCLPVKDGEGVNVYPDCAEAEIGDYVGTRYRVQVCQCGLFDGCIREKVWNEFICIPTDFDEYEIDDQVVLVYIGEDGFENGTEDTKKYACAVTARENALMELELDGQLIILPYTLE